MTLSMVSQFLVGNVLPLCGSFFRTCLRTSHHALGSWTLSLLVLQFELQAFQGKLKFSKLFLHGFKNEQRV
jgi:hypothetical protein